MAIGIQVNTPMGSVVGSISFQPRPVEGGVTVAIETKKAPIIGAIGVMTVLDHDQANKLLMELKDAMKPTVFVVEGEAELLDEEEPDL